MSHFIERCVCGVVVSQCRCPDPNKAKRTVSPCVHGETGELIEEEREAAEHLTAIDP